MLVLTLLACGNVSNAVFAEDAEFVAALPAEDRTTLDLPGTSLVSGTKAELGEVPELLAISLDVAVTVNSAIFDILGLVDDVRTIAPSARTRDTRSWGPLPACGGDLTAEVVRSGASQFDWRFNGANALGSADFLTGTHYAGSSVAAGDGQFTWDHARYGAFCGEESAGRLIVDYDNREGVDLLVTLDALQSGTQDIWDADYAYRYADESGDFQYLTTYDIEDDDTDELATVAVRTRWSRTLGGRSDAVLTGGALEDRIVQWTQCWGADLGMTYQHDSYALTEDLGDASACLYADFAEVDRL